MARLPLSLLFAGVVPGCCFGQPSTYDNCPDQVRQLMESLRAKHSLPGIQVAFAQNGVLKCAAALGFADTATQRAMTPSTLMRIGSISKTITGMAIAKLYEDGKLGLDDKAISFVPDLLPTGGPTDARWQQVTVRNLLQHSTGWEREQGGEPAQSTVAIAAALGIRAPAPSTDVIRWLLQQRLHFNPGTKESYTGVEYAFLAVIVERVSGLPYERYVQEKILEPSGVRRTMRVGRTLQEGRAYPADANLFEAAYTTSLTPATSVSVYPYITGPVPKPYGEWSNEALEGTGGWTANATGLLKYANKMFGRGSASIFTAQTLTAIQAKPAYEDASATSWYGIGWVIQSVPAGNRINFTGAIRGTAAHVMVLPNGNSYAVITNGDGLPTGTLTADIANDSFTLLSGTPALAGTLAGKPEYTDGPADLPIIRVQKGVVQGASFERGVTPGSWFSIIGWKLATTTRLWENSDFTQGSKLPTKIDGVEVTVNGLPAAVYYVSPTQINAQVPAIATPGTATLRVIRDGVASNPEPIEIRASSPEYFRYFLGSKSYVVAVHTDASVVADPVAAPGLRAATVGETIQVFGTGLVTAAAGDIVSTLVPVANVTARVGTQNAIVSFAGLVATGLFQVNLVVPSLAPGDYPVTLTVAGVGNLATAVLPVRSARGAGLCLS